jgi:hypothetical protein
MTDTSHVALHLLVRVCTLANGVSFEADITVMSIVSDCGPFMRGGASGASHLCKEHGRVMRSGVDWKYG